MVELIALAVIMFVCYWWGKTAGMEEAKREGQSKVVGSGEKLGQVTSVTKKR